MTKERLQTTIMELEEKEKLAWAQFNQILGQKEAFINLYNKLVEDEAKPNNPPPKLDEDPTAGSAGLKLLDECAGEPAPTTEGD